MTHDEHLDSLTNCSEGECPECGEVTKDGRRCGECQVCEDEYRAELHMEAER